MVPRQNPRVVIAGGGLAGLACAKKLAEAGLPVTVLESLPYLGGRASTFLDQDGEWVEQGLHLFLGAYAQFRALLRDIGRPPREVLYWTDDLKFESPSGPSALFGTNPVYAPLRTVLGGLGNNKYLGPLAKLSLLPLLAPAVLPEKLLRRFDRLTVVDWWRRASGSKQVLERVLRPFCRAIQFTDAEQFSAYNLLGWAHQTLIRPLRARLGGYRGARDPQIFAPLAAYLKQRGVEIRMQVEVDEIEYDANTGRIAGFRLVGGELLTADIYVVALPAWVFAPKIPQPLRNEPFFANIRDLPTAPAISVQLWFDRVVTRRDGYILVAGSNCAVYQDQSRRTYPYAQGSRISVIVSPADPLMDWDEAAIVAHVHADLGAANPQIAAAKVVKQVVLKHERHLIRPLPGAMTRRPMQTTPVENLFLAGDWTQQVFFGSQEGAVRGGNACARAVLRAVNRGL
ncbi:zeta-carotene desaturase [Nannocystis exedens]|uniref:Zeta-carotene desaturase n=1 Tax=Nannocystis exedens TaxID=54 RepID=A0A1I2ETQ1_9BACT|nr:FAD-dependent oxidoreductase [Nannocystis exedens]PCC73833.1 carotene 7,8-desaturase [Nannocystis exedens]SFE95600.1 zeta-carotene desaturase [Nannocystis exedens]